MNLVAPASSHTLVATTKPGMSQRKRFTARLQRARSHSNDFCSASSHMDNCGESRANAGDIPDSRGLIVIMSSRIGADSALLFG